MIVRVMGEGQYNLDDSHLAKLQELDDVVENAVNADDAEALAAALATLLAEVRQAGTPVADDVLVDSDLILPGADADLAEIKSWLNGQGSTEGLIPN